MNVKTNQRMKGQSAIEYLTTYGWMILVVAIVGGAIFTTVQNSSQIQSASVLSNSGIQVEAFGITNNGLEAEIRADSVDQVENVNLSLTNEETKETVYASEKVTIPVGGTETVSFPHVGSSENMNTYQIEARYDTGGLNDLTLKGSLTGRIEFSDTTQIDESNSGPGSTNGVPISGGSITSMATTSTFLNSSNVICVGPDCIETTGSKTGKYVNQSGDEMTGTLFVDNITDQSTTCFGELCSVEKGSKTGILGEDGNSMDGTLNITELKPENANRICVGTKC